MPRTITVLNATDPGEDVVFHDGEARTFGRDDDVCDIVIWSAINGRELSRVAGLLWRAHDQLWLRNLSSVHDLVVVGAGQVLGPSLPPRRGTDDVGAACAIPLGRSVVLGPGGCELVVTQCLTTDGVPAGPPSCGTTTQRLPPLPQRLRPVAAALCEPLLRGGTAAATYRQIGARLGVASYKRVRRQVGELCALYEEHLGSVAAQADPVAPAPRLVRGVWRFPDQDEPAAPTDDALRRLTPDYARVAALLVRRGLVRADALAVLPDGTPWAVEA